MAASYCNLGAAAAEATAALAAALTAKYGAGVTVHYSTSPYVIFTCAAVSDKVLKIYFQSNTGSQIWYGDAYTSGTTITNAVLFGENNGIMSERHVVLGDDFFFYWAKGSVGNHTAIVGPLSNGDYFAIGFSTSGTASYNNTSVGYVSTTNQQVYVIGIEKPSKTSANKLVRKPLHLIDYTTNVYVENGDGSPAYLDCDIWNVSLDVGGIVGGNFIVTDIVQYCWTGAVALRTPIMVEFTP